MCLAGFLSLGLMNCGDDEEDNNSTGPTDNGTSVDAALVATWNHYNPVMDTIVDDSSSNLVISENDACFGKSCINEGGGKLLASDGNIGRSLNTVKSYYYDYTLLDDSLFIVGDTTQTTSTVTLDTEGAAKYVKKQ